MAEGEQSIFMVPLQSPQNTTHAHVNTNILITLARSAEQWLVPNLIFGHAKWTQHVTLQQCVPLHHNPPTPPCHPHTKSRLQENLDTMTSSPNTKQHIMSAEEERPSAVTLKPRSLAVSTHCPFSQEGKKFIKWAICFNSTLFWHDHIHFERGGPPLKQAGDFAWLPGCTSWLQCLTWTWMGLVRDAEICLLKDVLALCTKPHTQTIIQNSGLMCPGSSFQSSWKPRAPNDDSKVQMPSSVEKRQSILNPWAG